MEYDSKEAIIQNLRDTGYSEDSIECCMACLNRGKKAGLLKQLENHRRCLLNKVHEEENAEMKMRVQVGGSTFTVALENNAAAEALAEISF